MELKNKKIFLIGGAGFIGSSVLDRLLELDNKVTVFDDFSTGEYKNIEHNIDGSTLNVIKGDIRELGHLTEAMKGHQVVINMATVCLRVSINDPYYVESVNSLGVLNVCQASLHNNVERLVYISSSEALGTAKFFPMDEEHPCHPTTVYGATKLSGESLTRAYFLTYKLPTIIIRPFNTYGPREHMVGKSAEIIPRMIIRIKSNQRPLIYGDGTQTRDFTYVSETAEGIILASGSDALIGDVVNIAYGEKVSINTIANLLLKLLHKEELGIDYPLPEGRPGDVQDHFANIQKAKKNLGFSPHINIEEGLKKYIQWLDSRNLDYSKMLQDTERNNW
jgi:UDP-glucose 4-epimerase